jgi:hypothetical protein
MKNKYNHFLILSTFFFLLGGVYLYFSNEIKVDGVIPVALGSSLVSSNGSSPSTALSIGDQIASDISFLTTLVSLKKMNIDTDLFTNKSFNSLQNNTVVIEPVVAGRQNPFSPIGDMNNTNSIPASPVVTDLPTQITDKTVSLNGTINTLSGVTDTYFEYGITETLGTVTSIAKPSLVGAFIKNISGLIPQTTYFFRACAKINNIKVCGEVVSFTTK